MELFFGNETIIYIRIVQDRFQGTTNRVKTAWDTINSGCSSRIGVHLSSHLFIVLMDDLLIGVEGTGPCECCSLMTSKFGILWFRLMETEYSSVAILCCHFVPILAVSDVILQCTKGEFLWRADGLTVVKCLGNNYTLARVAGGGIGGWCFLLKSNY